jgi:hypothetical protein
VAVVGERQTERIKSFHNITHLLKSLLEKANGAFHH